MLGIAHLVTGLALAGLCPLRGFQLGAKAILGSMGFVGDDDNVWAQGQYREGVFINPWHELLNGGEDDAATRPVGQFAAQVTP
ncbi:hypothetical protein D3C86_1824590 [compost metagenome]